MKKGGHNFHPSRVPGHTKFMTALEAEKLKKKKLAKLNKPLDLSKGDRSLR